MNEELVRLVLAVAALAIIVVAGLAARWLYHRLLDRHSGRSVEDLADRYELAAGEPTVLYFWTDRCGQCIELQEPALQRLAWATNVRVKKLHAPTESDVLDRFNIATVPSTIVVGPDLRVRRVNVGYADDATLSRQLA